MILLILYFKLIILLKKFIILFKNEYLAKN